MFKTIAWATDGSELADQALEHVRKLAEIHGSRIVAVHANEVIVGRAGSGARSTGLAGLALAAGFTTGAGGGTNSSSASSSASRSTRSVSVAVLAVTSRLPAAMSTQNCE